MVNKNRQPQVQFTERILVVTSEAVAAVRGEEKWQGCCERVEEERPEGFSSGSSQ
jgi:hypothetical protein